MATGLGGGGLPRIKELLAYLKALNDTVFTTAATTKAARVNLRDALGNELGTAAGTALKVDVSGDFPDNIQGAVENGVADIDPNLPGHRVKPVKIGSRANAAAPTAVAENQITDAWFDLYGRMNVAMSDGSLVTLGAIADAVVAAGATGSISAKLRRVSLDIEDLRALGVASGAGIKQDIIKIAGTAPSTAGKLDIKEADGDNVALGATADAVVAADASGSISAKLRRVTKDLDALHTTLKSINTVTPVTSSSTGVGAIAMTFGPAYNFYLHAITLHFDVAPTTPGNFVITLNPVDGTEYNTTLVLFDPSDLPITDMVYQPNIPLLCKNGDTISIAYVNADGRTYGIRSIIIAA